jgi:hypothetical protein
MAGVAWGLATPLSVVILIDWWSMGEIIRGREACIGRKRNRSQQVVRLIKTDYWRESQGGYRAKGLGRDFF